MMGRRSPIGSCYKKLYAPKGMNSAAGMSMDDSVNKLRARVGA